MRTMDATMTPLTERPKPRPQSPRPPASPRVSFTEPQRTFEQWYPEPIYAEQKTEQIERNVVIMVFVAFVAGLLLGKIMNPVILKH